MSIPCRTRSSILRQVGERLQCQLEEGACGLISRKFNRLIAGLTQIDHRLIPERRVEGVVGKAFDHIESVFLILRFHAAQHPAWSICRFAEISLP